MYRRLLANSPNRPKNYRETLKKWWLELCELIDKEYVEKMLFKTASGVYDEKCRQLKKDYIKIKDVEKIIDNNTGGSEKFIDLYPEEFKAKLKSK